MSAEPIDTDIDYELAASLNEARELVHEHGPHAKLVAGGQSLMLLLRHGLLDPEVLIDISQVPELNGIERRGDNVSLGATTTYADIDDHAVSSQYGSLGDAVDVIAGRQVRNMGTVGGAVSHADPSLDIVPPLLCRNARVQVGSVGGQRTIPLDEFHLGFMTSDLGDDEIVEQIIFDAAGENQGGAYETHSEIKGSWSTVGASTVVTLSNDGGVFESAQVALAAVGDSAVRGTSVETHLQDEKVSETVVSQASGAVTEDIDPMDDTSGSAAYKRKIAEVMVERSLCTAVARAGGEL